MCPQEVLKVKDPPEPNFEPSAAEAAVQAGEMFFTKPQQLLQVSVEGQPGVFELHCVSQVQHRSNPRCSCHSHSFCCYDVLAEVCLR